LSFAALFVTSGLETIGNTSGITIAGFDREADEKETSGAILADALGSTTAAFQCAAEYGVWAERRNCIDDQSGKPLVHCYRRVYFNDIGIFS